MIRVSVMYQNKPGATFDFDYYINKHVKEFDAKLKPYGHIKSQIDKGISGRNGAPPLYIAVGYMYFNSIEDYNKGMAAVAAARNPNEPSDIPNFTNTQSLSQVSEILVP